MSAAHVYVYGGLVVFVVALIPCWISVYEPIEHVYGWVLSGRTILGNAFAVPILGTLKAVGIAVGWPIVLPVAAIIWLVER